MGTVLRERIKSRSRSRSGMTWLMASFIGAGLALIVYQTIAHYSGNALPGFNFDIGSLWEDRATDNSNQPILQSDIVLETRPARETGALIRPPEPIHQLHSLRIRPKELGAPEVRAVNRHVLELEAESALPSIQLLTLPLPSESEVERLYLKQLEQDRLFDPHFEPKRGDWFVDVSFAPSISFRTLNYMEGMAGSKRDGNVTYIYGMTEGFRERTDKPLSTLYYGIELGRHVGTKLAVSTGVYYAVYGESIQVSRIEPETREKMSEEFQGAQPIYYCAEDKGQGSITYSNRYRYVEVPIKLRAQLVHWAKFSLGAEVAAYIQKLDHVSALLYDFKSDLYYWLPNRDLPVYNPVGWGVSMGLDMSQYITPRTELFVHPQLKLNQVQTFSSDYPLEQRQYSIGMQLGVRRHFADNSR